MRDLSQTEPLPRNGPKAGNRASLLERFEPLERFERLREFALDISSTLEYGGLNQQSHSTNEEEMMMKQILRSIVVMLALFADQA